MHTDGRTDGRTETHAGVYDTRKEGYGKRKAKRVPEGHRDETNDEISLLCGDGSDKRGGDRSKVGHGFNRKKKRTRRETRFGRDVI